jgi:hypothetical protein
MPTGLFIDGNVWNFLFNRKLDLAAELPAADWGIMHTREAEFEIPVGKPELDAFIGETMERCDVKTDSFFGFADETKPAMEQRYGGFDVARFAHPDEIKFLASQRASEVERPTKLQKHEADISLAARSFHSVVLTLDQRSAALKAASDQGGRVVWLNDIDASGQTLADFIKLAIAKRA